MSDEKNRITELETARSNGVLSWCETRILRPSPCPFCGGRAEVFHIGNEIRRTRSIRVKCKGCRAERVDGAIRHDFAWLEDVAIKNWNQRPPDYALPRMTHVRCAVCEFTISSLGFPDGTGERCFKLYGSDNPQPCGGELVRVDGPEPVD
jgi:hypothetical protein